MIPGLFPIMVGAVPQLTYNGYVENPNNGTLTDSLLSAPLGAEKAGRYVVAALAFSKAAAASASVTIDGVTAPLVPGTLSQYASSALFCGLYGAVIPAGTSGDVVMTVSSSTVSLLFAAMYSVYGLSSTSPRDVAISDANPIPLSVDVMSGGCAIALAHVNNATTMSWSGMTEDVDIQDTAGIPASTYSAASINRSAAIAPLTITATPAAGVPNCGCAASFR